MRHHHGANEYVTAALDYSCARIQEHARMHVLKRGVGNALRGPINFPGIKVFIASRIKRRAMYHRRHHHL